MQLVSGKDISVEAGSFIVIDVWELAGGALLKEAFAEYDVDEFCVSVTLQFDSVIIKISINDDFDSVEYIQVEFEQFDKLCKDRKIEAILEDLTGARLAFWWIMVNQQGYQDAIQMHFVETKSLKKIVQFLGLGSQILTMRVINDENK